MKKLAFLFTSILLVVVLAGSWTWIPLTWNTNEASVTDFITAETDTSDVFALAKLDEFQKNWLMPETMSFLFWVTEGANTDTINVTFSLQLSNDQTYWHDYGTLVQITDSGDSAQTVIDDIIKTDFGLFKYGRVHAISATGAGDTLSFGGDVTLDYSNY